MVKTEQLIDKPFMTKDGQHAQKSNSSVITHDQFKKMQHANLKLPKVQQDYTIVQKFFIIKNV
jgi:hypothetical protein